MTMTRRQAALLFSKTLAATPILAASSGVLTSDAVQGTSANREEGKSKAPVYIVLWFDTEDYMLPASDDAAKRIADFLDKQGIRATFKVVGEKARVLEQRQRTDVIAALSRQEIGYHSNTHSQQPTPAVYESVLDWELGQEEFDRRERAGFDDVRRIFGRPPSCYGQPGYSWAPQVYPTLKKWGVQVYLDDGQHVQIDGTPFWYGGLLNIFHIKAGLQLEQNEDWSNLEEAKANFKSIYAEMSSRPPGGLVSFMFHPTELISAKFWDAVNFADGANPPRSGWKRQPERSPAQREQAFQYLEGLITYMKSFPDVRFVTASEASVLYRDNAQGQQFSLHDLGDIASQVGSSITFQAHENYTLSSSEVFTLLNGFVARFASQGTRESIKLDFTPYGPSSRAYGMTMPDSNMKIAWNQFSRTSIDVNGFLEKRRAVPNAIWYGSTAVTPRVLSGSLGKCDPGTCFYRSSAGFCAGLAGRAWCSEVCSKGLHTSLALADISEWISFPALDGSCPIASMDTETGNPGEFKLRRD